MTLGLMPENKYENMIAAGVIDPTKVTRLALENACFNCWSVINYRSCSC